MVADCLNTRAEIRLRRGESRGAIEDSRACLARCQSAVPWMAVQALRRIGIAHGYLGEVTSAYSALRAALHYEPNNLDTKITLARLANDVSDHDTASAEYLGAWHILGPQRQRYPNGDFLLSTLLNKLTGAEVDAPFAAFTWERPEGARRGPTG
jgi:hypothetical protein